MHRIARRLRLAALSMAIALAWLGAAHDATAQRRRPSRLVIHANAGVALPRHSFVYTPSYVAVQKKFVIEQGVRFSYHLLTGIEAVTAVVEERIELVHLPGSEFLLARSLGAPLLAVAQTSDRLSLELVVSVKKAAASFGGGAPPLQERLKVLAGTTLAITRPGAIDHLFSLFAARRAGLRPPEAPAYVAPGGQGEQLRAMRDGLADGFAQTPPLSTIAEIEGFGRVILSAPRGDLPELHPFADALLVVRAQRQADADRTLRRVARGYVNALRYLRTPAGRNAAIESLQRVFSKLPAEVIAKAYDRLQPIFDADGVIELEGLERLQRLMLEAGTLANPLELQRAFTSEFLPDRARKEPRGEPGGLMR